MSQDGWALQSATEELKGDYEIVMAAVSQDGYALQDAAEELKGDREIVMAAVSQNGGALRFAAEELKGDREIVMAAVSHFGEALRHATKELKGDREIVLAAVSQSRFALRYVTEELKGDAEMMRNVIATEPCHLQRGGVLVVPPLYSFTSFLAFFVKAGGMAAGASLKKRSPSGHGDTPPFFFGTVAWVDSGGSPWKPNLTNN